MDSNNIIVFPKPNKRFDSHISTMEDVEESIEMVKYFHIQETLENSIPRLFDAFVVSGFDPEDNIEMVKHGAFVVEACRSYLSKIRDLYHPLQVVAENIFDEDEEGEIQVSETKKILIVEKEEE